MTKEVKNFVEQYNERMSWNRDILKKLKINYNKLNQYLQKIVDDYLTSEDITEEWVDLENAKLFEYGPEEKGWAGMLELQAFNKKTYGTTYFWVKPVGSEEEYKKNKIVQITEVLDEKIGDTEIKVKELMSGLKGIISFRKKFN